jgi:hypothetical protein
VPVKPLPTLLEKVLPLTTSLGTASPTAPPSGTTTTLFCAAAREIDKQTVRIATGYMKYFTLCPPFLSSRKQASGTNHHYTPAIHAGSLDFPDVLDTGLEADTKLGL